MLRNQCHNSISDIQTKRMMLPIIYLLFHSVVVQGYYTDIGEYCPPSEGNSHLYQCNNHFNI